MKQLLILSGKGGTGKTTIASAFIRLSETKAYADCDVDAPNLHLILPQTTQATKTDYYGLPKAEINTELCTSCDLCRQNCRFGAITKEELYRVDYFACEGCSVCELVCPSNAVSMKPAVVGHLYLYKGNNNEVFSTAKLKMGSGNSGKLVSEVKKQLQEEQRDTDVVIIDGSPGIGCPVIASLSGVDMVLIVTEPSLSGISDMERIIKTAQQFQMTIAVCINKFDTNMENTEKIISFCRNHDLAIVGKIPFDPKAVDDVNQGKSIVDVPCAAGYAARSVYEETIKIINQI